MELVKTQGLVYGAGMFAMGAHAAMKQVRKYTYDPYIVHPMEVAEFVKTVGGTDTMIAAALLHDVVEDTGVRIDQIGEIFGPEVATLVYELTDKYTKEEYPWMNRAERKYEEALRYEEVSNEAKTIKLADMISNTKSIAQHDPGFMKTYGPEKRTLLASLKGGDAILWEIADEILKEAGY